MTDDREIVEMVPPNIFEDTDFFIEEGNDRESCKECGGAGHNGFGACHNDLCYFGKIMTPYEHSIQQIIYKMHAERWRAQNAVETFEKSPLLLRWGYALRGKIDARFYNLGGHSVILSDRKGVAPVDLWTRKENL